MRYITHCRFRGKALCGVVNIPRGTACEARGDVLFCDDKAICYVASETAHNYFSRDDDGEGIKRGELVKEIMKRLTTREKRYRPNPNCPLAEPLMTSKEVARYNAAYNACQEAWKRVFADASIHKYKRVEFADYWVFNHDFYNAPIAELEHILKVVKGELK